MTPEQQLNAILISLGGWATITTILILLARRDLKMGLKKWFMTKFRKQPLKIRYHGPDKSVTEMVISMKGKGEVINLFDRKLLILKTKDGMTFLVDEASLRRCDDGINELSFSYKSIMAIDPTKTEEEIKKETSEFVTRLVTEEEKAMKDKAGKALKPLEVEELVRTTDPKRLNKLIDYIYLAAKADALAEATDVQKWVKITAIGVGIAIIGIIAIYYILDGKVIPLIQSVKDGMAVMVAQAQQVIKL